MRQRFITLLLFALCLPLIAAAQGKKALTLEEVVGGAFYAKNIYGVIPIPGNGEHYSQMNADRTQVIKYSFKTGKQVEVLFDATTARECPFKRFDSYSFSPDGSTLLIATETTPIYRLPPLLHGRTLSVQLEAQRRRNHQQQGGAPQRRRLATSASVLAGRVDGGLCAGCLQPLPRVCVPAFPHAASSRASVILQPSFSMQRTVGECVILHPER